jgi:predicted MPP superfamily phosphohydrolase
VDEVDMSGPSGRFFNAWLWLKEKKASTSSTSSTGWYALWLTVQLEIFPMTQGRISRCIALDEHATVAKDRIMSLFDIYVPTRTSHSMEVRLRTSDEGPVSISVHDRFACLESPNVSFGRYHFYRYIADELPSNSDFRVEVRQQSGDRQAEVRAATLDVPSGSLKLKIGVLADLHIPRTACSIEAYTPGTKRLTGLAEALALRYIQRLETLGADIIVLPGDLVEPCTAEMLSRLEAILESVSIPCYPIIGNHEPWSSGGEALFYSRLRLPPGGFYDVQRNGVRLLMLSTPDPTALGPGSTQRNWLKDQLDSAGPDEDIVIVSHFSLLLHPCVVGSRNDGYQLIHDHRDILNLIERYPNVRLFLAGHKNVPSVVERNGVLHTLSSQLIQAPCGYDLFQLYEGGVQRVTFEIDEQHYCETARVAYAHNWLLRYGSEHSRNFCINYSRK